MKVPEGIDSEMQIRPVTTVSDVKTNLPIFEIFRYGTETIVLPVEEEEEEPDNSEKYVPPEETVIHAEPEEEPVEEKASDDEEPDEEEETNVWAITERDIQREIGRYTGGEVSVEMLSATKAVVYIDDRDVPAAIGKGGKNIAAIVNKVGVGIDIRPSSELAKKVKALSPGQPDREELTLGDGLQVRIDKKQLSIISPDNTGKIVDVFAGREYLFTATVNDSGEIHLAKNSTIAQEMLRRYNEGEPIRLKTV